MRYEGTTMSDALSVTAIYTVLRPDLMRSYPGKGESHPFPEIIYLSRGRHYVAIDGIEYTFSEGQMILYAPDSFHSAGHLPPENTEASILTFQTDSVLLSPLYNRVITLNSRQRQMLTAIIDEGVGYFCGRPASDGINGMVLREGIDPSRLWGLKKQIEFFLIDVYESYTKKAECHGKAARRDAEFSEAVAFLQAHMTEQMTLSDIARATSMSVSKLKLLFREKAGTGPIDYLIQLRIERAKSLIEQGNMNFSQIAETVGFSSLHYFSRQFKKVTGISPSDFSRSVSS